MLDLGELAAAARDLLAETRVEQDRARPDGMHQLDVERDVEVAVQHDPHEAGALAGKPGDDELRAVVGEHGDPLARAHTDPGKRIGERVRLVVELAERELPVPVAHGEAIAKAFCGDDLWGSGAYEHFVLPPSWSGPRT